MSYYVYILHSEKLKTYYTGETSDIQLRLIYHNDAKLNSNSTKRGIPWVLYFQIQVKDRIQARKIESHIKKMKSRIYIENLKTYPEMRERLRKRYSD